MVTGEFPAQRADSAENVSIWSRDHEISLNVEGNDKTDMDLSIIGRDNTELSSIYPQFAFKSKHFTVIYTVSMMEIISH